MPEQFPIMPLRVDIISDVVCPWCIIGYKQLQRALDSLPGQFEVTLRWHPFELNPDMPAEGQDLREHLALKYGASPEQGRAARCARGAGSGHLRPLPDQAPGARARLTIPSEAPQLQPCNSARSIHAVFS